MKAIEHVHLQRLAKVALQVLHGRAHGRVSGEVVVDAVVAADFADDVLLAHGWKQDAIAGFERDR